MTSAAFAPVGVAVFGLSTPRVYSNFNLVRAIVEAITAKTLPLHIRTLDELREGFGRRDGGSVVVSSDLPDADLAAFICESGFPLIIIADDPEIAIRWSMQSRQMTAENAARFCSRVYSSLGCCAVGKRTLFLQADRTDMLQNVTAIVEFLWPDRANWLARKTHDYLVEIEKTALPVVEVQECAVGQEAAFAVALSALDCYTCLAEGRRPAEIVWPLPMFHRPDDRPWGQPIDLTGPSRAVLWGPYMHLPVGDWTARVEFEIDGAASGIEAITDVLVNEVLSQKTFEMPVKGIYAYELTFHVADPHHTVEIRLFTKKAAIEGQFLPRSVTVRPATAERPPSTVP